MVPCQDVQCMQVINYVLTRPAREALFTVVSDAEMYKAKLCIDTVVVRVGDTVAAGLFQVLEGIFSAGEQHGLASHGCACHEVNTPEKTFNICPGSQERKCAYKRVLSIEPCIAKMQSL